MCEAKLVLYENVIFMYEEPTISIQSVRLSTQNMTLNSKLYWQGYSISAVLSHYISSLLIVRNPEPYWQVNCDKKDKHFPLTVDQSPQQEGLPVDGQPPACQKEGGGFPREQVWTNLERGELGVPKWKRL